LVPIRVQNLVADYGRKALIRNLSFVVTQPSFVAVVGHNGSGKSTLLKALTGQLAFRGQVSVFGQEVSPLHNPAREGLLAFLEQKNHVNFSLMVRELVVMGNFRRMGFFQTYGPSDYQQAIRALDALRITHLADTNFQELSGGEQQMVWLAQLLVQDARVILLDEPTQQLDVYNRKKVFDLMARWVQQEGKTVLCVTHDIHNLFSMQGYLLNLSQPAPQLEEINELAVQRNLTLLEGKR
jgi:iron complex transport system ATP-binding protein